MGVAFIKKANVSDVIPKGNLTILQTQPGYIAAKTFAPDGGGGINKKHFDAGMFFTVHVENVTNIFELSDKLLSLSGEPRKFIIRDELAAHADPTQLVRRRSVKSGGVFQRRKEGLPWVMFDIDGIPCPDGVSLLTQPLEAIKHLINLLPSYFHGVTCHVHMSSSAGLDVGKTIRVHLWYWLTHPVTDAILKYWCHQVNSPFKLVDSSLFDAVHPHYTSDPIFKEGVDDPFPDGRSALIKGKNDSVDFPQIKVETKQYAGSTAGLKPANSFEQWCEFIGDHDSGLGFHEPLLNAAFHYVLEHGVEGTDVDALKQALCEAIDGADQSKHPDKSYIALKKSDSYLNGLIESAMVKIGAKGKNKNHLFHGLLPFYQPSKILSPTEASAELSKLVGGFCKNPRDMSIKAPAGIGKTVEVIVSTNKTFWLDNESGGSFKTEIYVPRHDLADEIKVAAKHIPHKKSKLPFQPKGVPSPLIVVVIRGRAYADETGKAFCIKHEVADALSKKGLAVFPNLCRNFPKNVQCEHYLDCRYIKQFQDNYDVRIYTHAHLALDRSFLDSEIPDFAVIDETFYSTLLVEKSIPLKVITNSNWPEPLIAAIETWLVTQSPLLKHLRDTLGDEGVFDVIKTAQNSIKKPTSPILFSMGVEDQKIAVKKIKSPTYLAEFLEVLRSELETGRDNAQGITYNSEKIELNLFYRKPITRFNDAMNDMLGLNGKKCHVLAIDADLNETIHEQFFPKTEHHKIAVERNCRVIQVYSTACSKTYLFHSGQDSVERQTEIQSLINKNSIDDKKVLVVAPQGLTGNTGKGLPAKLKTADPSDLAHFGNIRGMDMWKHNDAVIIAGRNQPAPEGAENVARALFYDSEEPLNITGELSYELRGYKVHGGLTAGVNVQVHPDPRIQQVLEQIRESESQQAIDRLRFIHGKKGRQVYLLSNLVLDVAVDSLISWTDLMAGGTKLEQAWEASEGVLPLSRVWLAENFPGLFKSEGVAKDEIKYLNDMGGILNNISIKSLTHLSRYEYRLFQQPGKASTCISQYALKETESKLKTMFGKEVASIKLVHPPANFSLADVKNELH